MASASESSQYLASKTSALTSTTPVSPSQAQAAQIPLQCFNLPTFPPEAFTAGLSSLILTSDIKLERYTDLLTEHFSVPELPASIKSLTLELFALGYPPSFLATLGERLPGLKSLTLYSQLFGGTTPASREDALTFLRFQTEIQELHLLDVFGPSNFFTSLSAHLSPSLKFLEVNYTYRHSDPQFLVTIPSTDLPSLISSALVALTLSISAPDIADNSEDREGTETGIVPISNPSLSSSLVEKLVKEGTGLVMLDITMFELSSGDVESLLDGSGRLKALNFTVGLEEGWEVIFDVLRRRQRNVEVLEVVGVPGEGMVERFKGDGGMVGKSLLEVLGGTWKALKSVKVSVLRTRAEHWVKDGEVWEMKS